MLEQKCKSEKKDLLTTTDN